MLELLTVEKLKAMNDGDIFAQGTIVDSPEGINMARTEKMLDWVACRGQGYHDWAIYCTFSDSYWSEDNIHDMGDKVTGEKNIKKLVPCDNEAFELYRY